VTVDSDAVHLSSPHHPGVVKPFTSVVEPGQYEREDRLGLREVRALAADSRDIAGEIARGADAERARCNCGLGKTPEQNSIVVEVLRDCRDKTAAVLGASEPVRVFSTDGGTALPRGFSGISSVVASSSGPCVPPLAPTQAGGSFLTSTAGIITMAAVAVGVTTAIIVATNDDEVASPIR